MPSFEVGNELEYKEKDAQHQEQLDDLIKLRFRPMRRRSGGDAPIRRAYERDDAAGDESERVRDFMQLEEVNPRELPRAARAVLLSRRRPGGGRRGLDVYG